VPYSSRHFYFSPVRHLPIARHKYRCLRHLFLLTVYTLKNHLLAKLCPASPACYNEHTNDLERELKRERRAAAYPWGPWPRWASWRPRGRWPRRRGPTEKRAKSSGLPLRPLTSLSFLTASRTLASSSWSQMSTWTVSSWHRMIKPFLW